jgi:hypothetical protein
MEHWESLLERLEEIDDAITALEARLSDTDEPSTPLDEVLAESDLERKREVAVP